MEENSRERSTKGRSYTFKQVHLYNGTGGGLSGIQLPQRLRGTLFLYPWKATPLVSRSLATFPFLQERTGALPSAVNCTPVIRSKAVVLSAPSRDGCSLRLSVMGRAYADGAIRLWWKSRRSYESGNYNARHVFGYSKCGNMIGAKLALTILIGPITRNVNFT